ENIRRSNFLAAASAVLSETLDYSATLQKLAAMSVPAFADWCTVSVLTERDLERVAVVHKDPAKDPTAKEYQAHSPPGDHKVGEYGEVLTTGRAVLAPHVTDRDLAAAAQSPDHLRIMRSLGVASCIMVPLAAAGKVIGVLSFVRSEPGHAFSEADF